MKPARSSPWGPFVLLLATAASAFAAAPSESSEPLGRLEFPITGSAECQRLFRQGMLEMHSFQYDQAHASFGAALNADAGCAMAAWGEAMASEHPIWSERDAARAETALAEVRAGSGERRAAAQPGP